MVTPLRGFTGGGGGMSTPHLEPRPWLPSAHEFSPFHPYQMAAIVIGWPLLLPGALGGSYFGPPQRERKRDELVLIMAASGDVQGLGLVAMQVGGLFIGGLGPSLGSSVKTGNVGAEFQGIMKLGAEHRHVGTTLLKLPGSVLMKSIDSIRMNKWWRWQSTVEMRELNELDRRE